MLEFCRKAQGTRNPLVRASREPLVELDTDSALTRAEQWVTDHAPEVWEGERNATAFKVGAQLREFGLSEHYVLDEALRWNAEKVYPPLETEEIDHVVASVFRSAKGGWGGASAAADFEPVEILEPAPIKPKRKGLFWMRFKAAAETAFEESIEPLIEGLLDTTAMSVIYGHSGSYKTFVTLDIAFHIAAGRPWQGRAVCQGLGVYIAAEGGRGIRKRLAALRKHYGVDDIPFALVPCPINLLDAKADLPELIKLIHAAEESYGAPARLVVIDTLSRALAGGDENTSTDMGAFVRNVDQIRAQVPTTHLCIVHHSGKDASKGARGWSGLRAATDTEIEIVGGEIRVSKQRDMDPMPPLKFVVDDVALGNDAKGRPVKSGVVRVLTGTEFAPIELSGAEAEMYEAFVDCAKEKGEKENTDWKTQTITTDEWDASFLANVENAKAGTSVRTRRRLRSAIAESGHLKKIGQDRWVVS